MLIERLLGVAVYAGLLLVMYLAVRSAKNYTSLCRILNTYVVLLCVMAFFYIPERSADLYRWREVFVEYGWADQSFSEFFDGQLIRTSTPIAYLYMYLINLTGIKGLLPAFCTLVFCGNAFYILKDLYRRHQVSARSISVALFFLMAGGGFLEVISGVRCFVSLSILARCFYDELFNDKPILKNIIWEGLAALIHSMAAVLLVGRLLFTLIQKNRRPVEKVVNIVLTAAIVLFVFQFGVDYIVAALSKAEYYATNDDGYTFFWEYLIGAIVMFQFAFVLLKVRRTSKRMPEQHGMRNLIRFNLALFAVELVLAFEYNMFHRLIMFSTLTMTPLTAVAVDDPHNRGLNRMIWLLSILVLFLACARGNMSGYKFILFQ